MNLEPPRKVLHVPATVHGRVLVDHTPDALGVLAGFHGYGQVAEDIQEQLNQIPGADRWTRVSIQALHPFYTRGDTKVVASWMTRQDRDLAIADNTRYTIDALTAALSTAHHTRSTKRDAPRPEHQALRTILVGFSQGAAMAYRTALAWPGGVSAVVALAGDIPPELRAVAAVKWPRVLIGVGDREEWYAGGKLQADLDFLRVQGIEHEVVRFDGGHEWTGEFRAAVGRLLESAI